MSRNALIFSLFFALHFVDASDAQLRSSGQALRESARTGKPIFAISTSETCPPCRQLKLTVHHDSRVRAVLEGFVLLEMDSSSPDFTQFQQRFPGEYFGVPMIHVISGAGEILYARSGNLPADQLVQLLSYALSRHESVATRKAEINHTGDLEEARAQALKGELAEALQRVTPIARLDEDSRDVVVARAYKQQLEAAISDWLEELEDDMTDAKSQHASAYRLAKLFTELPKGTRSRQRALDLMQHVESSRETRTAMQQAKQLVRARIEEDRNLCEAAITTYENVIKLGATTPSGAYAHSRIPLLRERQQMKLTAAP